MAEELETKVENNEETHDSNNEGRQWYVVNTYSGHENKVKENLEKRVESMGLQNILFNIVIPEHVETEIKNGKKVNKTVNTPGVTGFIGSSGGGAKPFPVNKRELDPILKSMGIQTTAVEVDFVEGDYVEVLAGPFASKSGKVESIDKEKETATVLVDFLGNLTPIDMELIQLKKIEE